MAKLSARGAHVVARWRRGLDGSEYVLRSDGAVLWKAKGGSWQTTIRPNNRLEEKNPKHMANVETAMQFTKRGYAKVQP